MMIVVVMIMLHKRLCGEDVIAKIGHQQAKVAFDATPCSFSDEKATRAARTV